MHGMLGEQRQHVVEEADARGDVGLAGAVEVERELDLRLGRFAVDGGGSCHARCLLEPEFEPLSPS